MPTICNYILLDEATSLYAGDDYEGSVYTANINVEAGDRFKYASWALASEDQRKHYWSVQRANRLASQDANYCPETGESVFFCCCGYH
jgi:hypothetical protein